MKNTIKHLLVIGFLSVGFISCNDDENPSKVVPTQTDAEFSYTIDPENVNTYHFSASPNVATWFTHWSFGDGTSAIGLEVTKTYFVKGNYEVRFKILTTGGEASTTQSISIENDAVDESNLVANGTFEDNSGWTIINHFEASNTLGTVTIADGEVKFEEESAGPWKHMGIYTEVELEAGATYQFDMDMSFTEIHDVWGEVYIGQGVPVAGSDYNGDFQVIKAYNAWDCSPKTYSGKATAYGCDSNPNPGSFTASESGTYYLLFRTGGAQYGSEGIVIDNVELREQE